MAGDGTTRDYLTDKDILRITEDGLDQGKTRDEIIEELLLRHDSKEYLEQVMGRVPDPALRRRYKAVNQVLVALLIAMGLLNAGMLLLALLVGIRHHLVFEGVFMPSIFVWCLPSIRRMQPLYTPTALLSLGGVLQSTRLMGAFPTWGLLNVILFVAIGGLAWYIGPRLFPEAPLKESGKNTGVTDTP